MTQHAPEPEFCPLGVDGILVRFSRTLSMAANAQALGLRDVLLEAALPGVTEVASSLTSLRVGFDPTKTDRAAVTASVQRLLDAPRSSPQEARRTWHIPVAFGPDHAPQLAEAAALAGVTPEKAVAQITAEPLRVIAIGFAPGQPYLGMLPQNWEIPRQSTLTEGLPRGAIITAVRQCMIWAADAPTGWRHIGQSAFEVYRPQADDPFAFAPGDAMQFHAVGDAEFAAIAADDATNGGARCEVAF